LVQARFAKQCPSEGPITLGIRPEHAVPCETGGIRAAAELVEPAGHAIILHLRLAGQPFRVRTHDRRWLAPGPEIGVDFPAGQLHLFDAGGARAV